MSFLVRADGQVVLTCHVCRSFLARDGSRSSLPAAKTAREAVEAAYKDPEDAVVVAVRSGWRRSSLRREAWLCPACRARAGA